MEAPLVTQERLQHQIERALDNFKKIGKKNLTPAIIRSRINSLKEIWSQFQDGHDGLVESTLEASQIKLTYFQTSVFDNTEEIYNSTLDFMSEWLEEREPRVSLTQACSSVQSRAECQAPSFSHLPPIKLPPFDGKLEEWESFRDRFNSLIRANKDLTDFTRMHYLTSSLRGSALECIANLPVTSENFATAWNALTSRYENPRRLLDLHLTNLLNLPSVTRESATEMQSLRDKVNIIVASLRSLNRTEKELWNDILVHIIIQKLDPITRKAWNLKTSESETLASYDTVNRFLTARTRALEEFTASPAPKPKVPSIQRAHVATASTNTLNQCPLCQSRHFINLCPDRSSKYLCRICRQRHHSTLRVNSELGSKRSVTDSPARANPSDTDNQLNLVPHRADSRTNVTSMLVSAQQSMRKQVLLATAWVAVSGSSGRSVNIRALIDQGSEITFISENVAQRLRVKRIHMPISVSAVGGIHAGIFRHAAEIFVSPRDTRDPSLSTTALILPSLTKYSPEQSSSLASLDHLSDLSWADENPTSSDPIQIIIGADLYGSLILEGVRKGSIGQPVAQNSILGWIISGPIESDSSFDHSKQDLHSVESLHLSLSIASVHHIVSSTSLDTELRRFWEIEEIPKNAILSPQEKQCEKHFLQTHSRDSNGRYIVRLPFKAGPPIDIGHSYFRAEILLNCLLRRLQEKPDIATEYRDFLNEYETLRHMEKISPNEADPERSFYIPHHGVVRDSSLTTHLRVVFNASSLSSNNSSLNDHLLAGPKLQTDISTVILKWRQYKYVYSADIAKMYRQVQLDSRDRDYQRILWKISKDAPVIKYRLSTVTCGLTCAPYLALRVINQLNLDEGHRFPLAPSILRENIYVDDLLFGADDASVLKTKQTQIISLLQCGGFELKKWASNSAQLLSDIDTRHHGLASPKLSQEKDQINILGIQWDPHDDEFNIKLSLHSAAPETKRTILSAIAKIYDPMGWITPVTIAARIFMQQLWRIKITWDERIPENLLSQWIRIYHAFHSLNSLRIPRWTGCDENTTRMEIHGFADASNVAYAAAVYLKLTSRSGDVKITMLAGKSKVAPIKPLSVPRLELSAALLLSRLIDFARSSLNEKVTHCYCWTDSRVVLAWVTQHPSRWKAFVANRVTEMQSRLPNAEWRHVSTECNPADCASRGVLSTEIINHPLWRTGPTWLKLNSDKWPSHSVDLAAKAPLEEKIVSTQCSISPTQWDLAARYSSWPKLVRVAAYILKFIRCCRQIQSERRSRGTKPFPQFRNPSLSARDCAEARSFWIKTIQTELFSNEIHSLNTNKQLPCKSSLLGSQPFIDSEGLLRVGGRIKRAPIPFSVRHPILLESHPLVKLVIERAHLRSLHGGPQLTMNILRREFWIIRALSVVRYVLHKCVKCTRERAITPSQIMGDFPTPRVPSPGRSFLHCGIDYAGPIQTRASAGRGITARKAYIAVFVYLASKARFCARRGIPQAMCSDNSTTFVGADREVTRAHQAALHDPNSLNKTASDNITWNFIPPSAPHFGGLWGSRVRSVKYHLRRVIGPHKLTYEEFATLLCRIEACLNSRPLSPITDSFDDVEYLTPGHFLIGSMLTVSPEPTLLNLNENRPSRWQIIRHITEKCWKSWQNDCINTLQRRVKWQRVTPSLKIGQLVLLKNSTLPPCKWELGRVTKVHPGNDGHVRVVTVKTALSEFKRPIVQLRVLPVDLEAMKKTEN